jgi:hypothetical protein
MFNTHPRKNQCVLRIYSLRRSLVVYVTARIDPKSPYNYIDQGDHGLCKIQDFLAKSMFNFSRYVDYHIDLKGSKGMFLCDKNLR